MTSSSSTTSTLPRLSLTRVLTRLTELAVTVLARVSNGARTNRTGSLCLLRAPVAQGIEHRPPEAVAQVRILPGAPGLSWQNTTLLSNVDGHVTRLWTR